MEKPQRVDLTYITERIITIFCPPGSPEEIYLQNLQEIIHMLQSKHGHSYMLINLSQKNDTLTQMNHKVLDTGWVDLLAPNLDQIFSVCTMMENWLQSHPKHVLVLHCRGGKGRLGVLVASYIHFSNMSASADLSLDHFAMRRFYNDKLSALMTPSQKRYVWMLGSMLKGGLRMCPSPSFLLCVVLHGLPKIRPDGGREEACCLHLFILLKEEDVVCYDKNSQSDSRQVVFRLQFHTGLVHGHALTFFKADLDCASEALPLCLLVCLSFPRVGRELWHNGHGVTVDYDTLDPLVRRDSYQDTSPPETGEVDVVFTAPPLVLDPGNGSLYSRVRKKSSEEGALFSLTTSSPSCSDRAPSGSSDSGLSVASQGRAGAGHKRGAAGDKSTLAGKLVAGVDFEIAQPLLEVMTELAASGGEGEVAGDESGLGLTINGEASSSERETDILDDEDEVAASGLDMPSSSSICSLSSESLPGTQTEYSTRSWVQQQQMVEVVTDNYLEVDGGARLKRGRKERPPPLVAPDTPLRGMSSREAVQRGPGDDDGTHNGQSVSTTLASSCQEEDLASLNTDIDESIEQLNQLILDLDPTFVPVPTRCAPLSRSASLHTNGLSHKGNTNQSDDSDTFFPPLTLPISPCSSTPPPVWHDRTPNSLNSPYHSQPSPPLSLSTPNAHSSPRGVLRGLDGGLGVRRETDSTDLSSLLLGNGGLEHSLLEAMEGLGSLNLGGDRGLPPLLPEKRRLGEGGELGSCSPSLSGFSSPHSGSSLSIPFSSPMTPDPLRGLSGTQSPGADCGSKQDTVKFVQDTSKFWYKPDISRDQAIAVLKDKEPGSFIVRDSHSFRGAYGLAMKVATPPPSVLQQSKKGDLSNELVRHFLIECTQKGVRLKGCPNEPYFGSLTALVCQHSITPLALPCKLILPDRDPVEELSDSSAQTSTNSAAELLKQGAACNVWYLGSVALESLTGHQAVQKATTLTLAMDPPPASTVVHFKVSAQGITLTDNQRKLFFRRHYAVNTVIFCSLDPQGRKWINSTTGKRIFGFVARKSQSETENMCHLFAEHDPEQPASAIVNFVSKVMIGSHKK
uniref:Tensin 3 n=1 Tax=Dicentrarchus labrax TaxID=13489 RepID=A0A8C4FCY4_DICLA